MEIERAKTISDVAQTLINSAKVELQFMELIGEDQGGQFFEPQPRLPRASAPTRENAARNVFTGPRSTRNTQVTSG